MGDKKMDVECKVAHLMTLEEIFDKRYFKIPDYQRGYSWGPRQINDLIIDIENVRNADYQHYAGAIVASLIENENEYEIVDGQQRLTTLLIMIQQCIIHGAEKSEYLSERFVEDGEIGNKRRKFIPNKEDSEVFKSVIINDHDRNAIKLEIKSHENIYEARKIISEWIEKLKKEGIGVDGIVETLLSKIGFIFFTPKNSKEIGVMFEVINNRGKALSQLEKIKNFLIYFATKTDLKNLNESVNEKWGTILKNLNHAKKSTVDDETNFLRYAWIVYFDKSKQKSSDVYGALKSRYDINPQDKEKKTEIFKQLNSFIQFLELSSQNYLTIFDSKETQRQYSDERLIKIIKSLRSQGTHASIMPLVLAVMAKATVDEQKELLDIIEKLNFRVYVLPNVTFRSDTGQGKLFSYAYDFFHKYDDYKDKNYIDESRSKYKNISEWLKESLIEFTNIYCDCNKLEEALSRDDYNYYQNWRGLRYFLMSYEEYINDKRTIEIEKILLTRKEVKTNDYYSIEHYWAEENRNKPGLNDREQDRMLKQRIGNLGLLEMGINSSASDKSLEDKFENSYFGNSQTHLKQIKIAKELYGRIHEEHEKEASKEKKRKTKNYYYELYKDFIEQMEEKYIEFALERWGFDSDDCK